MWWDFFRQHHEKAEIRGYPGGQITFGQLWEIMHYGAIQNRTPLRTAVEFA